MNKEKQRIAIAQACGWTQIEPCTCCDGVSRGYQPTPGAHKKHLPDYLHDLNAMAEAEKMLSWKDEGPATSQRRRYLMNLEAVISGPPNRFGERPNRTLSVPFATAAQRARAFLETLGLWEDDK